ncbi:TMV resistance protein N-like [Eucalyptus grandis]|uniref:TMV resistance protein N-like n=1 Tax=Eucalyptus grandis TaxID=71139 RepID=UPI00192E810C|nr:TMV resistance protein N-like [Eucalyptus grandis]
MDWREKALTGLIVAVVILSLTMAPTWFMAFLILFGVIAPAAVAAVEKMGTNQASAADDAPALALDAVALDVDALALADAAAGNPESSSASSSSSKFKYDIYLNFRGPDTRYGFADLLYRQLDDARIRVFNDGYDLTPGKEIWPQINGAIERSRISIAIFSRNFASSTFCLKELVQMWECKKINRQTIIPIFYDVYPDDVALRTGLFRDDLSQLEQRGIDPNTMETWKEVLRRPEGQFRQEVVARVRQLLKEDYQFVDDELVGIEHHVQEMMKKLGVAYCERQAIEVRGQEVRVVAICGVPGVGKTTLAKAVFYKMRELFDAHSFLEDIRSEGVQLSRQMLIVDLQKHIPAPHESSGEETKKIASLCRDAKVLIVLDSVDKDEQIKELAGKLTWFGPGSRIIVTTNKKNVLKAFEVGAVEEHTVKPMDQRHAHKLFCKHAFQGDTAQDVSEYFGLSLDMAKAIGGLPSDIVRQASSLREEIYHITYVAHSPLEELRFKFDHIPLIAALYPIL